jgi:hypothetical protein
MPMKFEIALKLIRDFVIIAIGLTIAKEIFGASEFTRSKDSFLMTVGIFWFFCAWIDLFIPWGETNFAYCIFSAIIAIIIFSIGAVNAPVIEAPVSLAPSLAPSSSNAQSPAIEPINADSTSKWLLTATYPPNQNITAQIIGTPSEANKIAKGLSDEYKSKYPEIPVTITLQIIDGEPIQKYQNNKSSYIYY